MNPRGHQYALAGTLTAWTRLINPSPRQVRALRRAYRGLSPRVYSKYGLRQWAAPLPTTRLIVKDPFAMLSIPAVIDATRAQVVLIYRHPAAVLASYRRMGWKPKVEEFVAILAAARASGMSDIDAQADPESFDDVALFASIWAALHQLALSDIAGRGVIVLSHQDLATGGAQAGKALAAALDLTWTEGMRSELAKESRSPVDGSNLHNFERAPAAVAVEWREHLDASEIRVCEERTSGVRSLLEQQKIPLG